MSYLRKFGLLFTVFAFCMSLAVVTSFAQPGKARWEGNNGRHRGWEQGKRNGWNNGRKTGWRNRNNDYYWQQNRYGSRDYYSRQNRWGGRVTPREYWRMQRQRSRIYRNTDRYYSDGYLSDKESRKLMKQRYKYRRSAYRNRRDW